MAKGKPVGPRVAIGWGSISIKQGGKKVNKQTSSNVLESTAKLFGLTASKAIQPKIVNVKTSKGSRKIIKTPSTALSRRVIEATVDGKVWHRVPVPQGISLAKAYAIFQKGKKAYAIKFQGGIPKIIGKPSKDTKTKSKAAAKNPK